MRLMMGLCVRCGGQFPDASEYLGTSTYSAANGNTAVVPHDMRWPCMIRPRDVDEIMNG
jgi:hypothetical protein